MNENKKNYAKPEMKVYGSVRNLTGGSGGKMDDAGSTLNDGQMSDPRAKENIVRVGTHDAGFGLYLFDYKAEFQARWGADRKFGVMADEVAQVMPEAIIEDASGYRTVDYAALGIVLH